MLVQQMPYTDLGIDYYSQRADAPAHARRLARQIEKLGYHVNIEPSEAA